MKFDAIDKRLLIYLYHHYRDSFAAIAKACGISKEQVAYRIGKFERSGLIHSYLTLYDYARLGYNEFVFAFIRCKDKDALCKDLTGRKYVLSYADVLGEYNLVINFICKDKNHFEYEFNELLKEHKDNVLDYDLMPLTHIEFYSLKMFGNKKPQQVYTVVHYETPLTLDAVDQKLLRLLENEGRMPLTDIARRLGMSAPAALKRLRSLKERGVIQGTRLLLNMELFGYYWAEINAQFRSMDEQTKRKIISYCRLHPTVNAVMIGVGAFNCNIQLVYHSDEELRSAIRDTLKQFKNDIDKYSIILVENERGAHTYPFA